MIAYTLGVLSACALAATLPGVAEVWLFGEPGWYAARWSASLAWVCCVQVLASALIADLLHAVSPRAMFMRGRWNGASMIAGLIAGALACALTLVVAALGLRRYGDASAVEPFFAAGCAAAASVFVLTCTRRHRAGRCAGCGYDLRELTPASHGRCPECGRDHFAPGVV